MKSALIKVIAGLIRVYQLTLGLLFAGQCRYYPTCSEYARQAVMKYGPSHGLFLALKRLLRCHPYSRGGYDPVN